MKEKMSVAMISSTCLMVLILLLTLIFPQIFNEVELKGFVKGVASALVCIVAGLIGAFKNKKTGA